MFDQDPSPRLFATAPGEDFSQGLVQGLLQRIDGLDPFAVARIKVVVNTRRTGRRLTALLSAAGARLLPRILPVAELALDPSAALPAPVSALRRRLELSQLVLRLLDADPGLAPRASAFDLAETLVRLIDEMHEEGVSAETLLGQDFGELSGHWQRSLKVLGIVTRYVAPDSGADLTPAALLDLQVRRLTRRWAETPPLDPVLVVGSTGSRGTTFRLMQAVALLPQGAVVLPGFDFDQPGAVWQRILQDRTEDHPQYRFARLCQALDSRPDRVRHWLGARPAATAQSGLVSLALRPAPVSDQWIVEGPGLGDLAAATAGLTLIEAPSPRAEALAIATVAREAVSRGKVTAVITADRDLTRMITAELQRWGIDADDSAGEPLSQTTPGRLLRHTAELMLAPARVEAMLVLLKHPLVHAAAGRGRHLDLTRRLELRLRREGRPYPAAADLLRMIAKDRVKEVIAELIDPETGDPLGLLSDNDINRVVRPSSERTEADNVAPDEDQGETQLAERDAAWADWVAACLTGQASPGRRPLDQHVAAHLSLTEALSLGSRAEPGAEPPVWKGAAGQMSRRTLAELDRESAAGGLLTAAEYRDLVQDLLMRGEVRAEAEAHTGVRFWGTIEARIQGADLMVLAGLNEGLWPARPAPDPWLNRAMRKAVGLTLPERRIGLSAHDFQQAVSAPEVVLSRALKDEAAEAVPSRWLNRMLNLLDGLPDTGKPALAAMRARGAAWLDLAARLDAPPRGLDRQAAPRPAPAPPVKQRPTRLSVTEIQTLIRDPYAIYARHVLGLRALDPLRPEPDARAQGTLIHKAMENFLNATLDDPAAISAELLLEKAEAALDQAAPWPGIRHIWRGRLAGNADWIVKEEFKRRGLGQPFAIEKKAEWQVPGHDMLLIGKADRVDLLADGSAEILDYKTGGVPTKKDIKHFDRQLMLLALMIEAGALGRPLTVSALSHVGLGSTPKEAGTKIDEFPLAEVRAELLALLGAYSDPNKGYAARRAQESLRWGGDFDHLARFGEWSASDPAVTMKLDAGQE